MVEKKVETQCPKCSERFLTRVELADPVAPEVDRAKLTEQVTLLEQEKAALKERSDSLAVLEELIKTPEGFVEFAGKFGYLALIPPDPAAQAKVEEEGKKPGAKPQSVIGKVDDPDYEFYPNYGVKGISILKPVSVAALAAKEG